MSFRPWLLIPPQWAHDGAPFFINTYAALSPRRHYVWQPFTWRGLHFPNRLGIAGGVDKDGKTMNAWEKLGAGFVEVGTVTPQPQGPNPGRTVDRRVGAAALWNKLGFPSEGAARVRARLEKSKPRVPVFVNIGKNRATPNERAFADYAGLARSFSARADALVVNVSSPNTQDLRHLQQKEYLGELLRHVNEANSKKIPVLLKLSPDLQDGELEEIFEVSLSHDIDGWILTNTTRARPPGIAFPAEGGLSGAPLAERSKRTLKKAVGILGSSKGDRLLISVGGVMSGEDIAERIEMGADLTQAYSALIFSGPGFFGRVARVFADRK